VSLVLVLGRNAVSFEVGPRRCPHCNGPLVHASRRTGLAEHFVYPLMLMRPFRCGECDNRHKGFIFRRMDADAASKVVLLESMPASVAATVRPATARGAVPAAKAKPKRIWISENRTLFANGGGLPARETITSSPVRKQTADVELSTCRFSGSHAPKSLE
jgi:hypothetical protein